MKISKEVMLYCSTHTISQVEVAYNHAVRRAASFRRLYRNEDNKLSLDRRAERYWVNAIEFDQLSRELAICLEAMREDRDRPPFDPN